MLVLNASVESRGKENSILYAPISFFQYVMLHNGMKKDVVVCDC